VEGTNISHWLLMVVFFGVLFAIPILWYVVGIKTYGTGDYWQP
jgi:ABC-type Na+ efflux pump permease subunit